MIIINSGAFVIPEFQVEIGKIPPCLLPVANKKLIEHQVEALRDNFNESIYVTLPDTYDITYDEEILFSTLEVSIIKTSIHFNLAEAILYVLNITNTKDGEPIRLLHGDTLLLEYPKNMDNCLGLGSTSYNYMWEVESQEMENGPLEVWCGYFSFSDKPLLTKILALSQGDFVRAVRSYNNYTELSSIYFLDWYDFGHINTYFHSRALLTTERAFNSLKIKNNILRKTGQPSRKIEAEALWFQNIPSNLKIYTPQLLNYNKENGNYFYEIEFLSIMPLNELFVHGKKPAKEWKFILDKIFEFLDKSAKDDLDSKDKSKISTSFKDLVVTKTLQRVQDYINIEQFNLNNPLVINNTNTTSLKEIIDICILKVLKLPDMPAIVHGDLCLSNVLFDSRSEQIKLIDPRGLNNNNDITIYGDRKYDFAKLAHSIIGLYDLIISNRFTYIEHNKYNFDIDFHLNDEIKKIQSVFLEYKINETTTKDLIPLVILLFISMLPLHSDRKDRQKAMLANSVRLYSEYLQ